MKHLFIINPLLVKDHMMERIKLPGEPAPRERREYYISRFPRDALTAVRTAFADCSPGETIRVWAVGGGGTFLDCLNAVRGIPHSQLAFVPLGDTPASLLDAFGNSPDVAAAFQDMERQLAAAPAKFDIIDTGRVRGIKFCAVGIYAAAAKGAEDLRKYFRAGKLGVVSGGILRWLSVIREALSPSNRCRYYEVTIDGADYSGEYNSVAINNIRVKNGNADVQPDDGSLEIALCGGSRISDALRSDKAIRGGNYHRYPSVTVVSGKHVMIALPSRDPICVNLDGEIFHEANLEVTIRSSAATVMLPEGISLYRGA